MTALEGLAKDYADYENKVQVYAPFGQRMCDLTPKGMKAASTRKYNKFADACEKAGLTLKEQATILQRFMY